MGERKYTNHQNVVFARLYYLFYVFYTTLFINLLHINNKIARFDQYKGSCKATWHLPSVSEKTLLE